MRSRIVAILLGALSIAFGCSSSGHAASSGQYYIEFRARPLWFYGHTYMVYGSLDGTGKPASEHYIGLFPQGGQLGLIAGSTLIDVPGTTARAWGDKNLHTIVAYRAKLNSNQYRRLIVFVRDTQSRQLTWNLYYDNCNRFAGSVALAVGLKAPAISFAPAPVYVSQLGALNSAK